MPEQSKLRFLEALEVQIAHSSLRQLKAVKETVKVKLFVTVNVRDLLKLFK